MTNQILKKAEDYRDEIVKFLIDITKIKSFSCEEKAVADRIKKEMKKIGFDEVRIDGLGSVIGRIGNGPTKIAFDGHIDTVDIGNPKNWTFDPFDAHVDGNNVYGRGVADQKGGVASMIYAGKIIKELGLAKDATVYLVGSVMEEDCDGLCWDYLIKEEDFKPDICVLTEPTNLGVYRGQRGRMEITIAVSGVSCHGSAPERGENAIYMIAPLINRIEMLNEILPIDKLLGKGSVAVTKIESTSPSLCAVPDHCYVHLDRRLTLGETEESAIAELMELMDREDYNVDVPVYEKTSYTGNIYPMKKYFPAWHLPKDHPAVVTANQSFKKLFDKETETGSWQFSTNGVAIMGLNDIPCIGFGPGSEEQAHASNEFIPIEDLVKATAFYAEFANLYCSSGASA